jgi:hypothetical protein
VRRVLFRASAGLAVCLALLTGGQAALGTEKSEKKAGCGDYGTSIDFYSSPSKAAAAAKKEEKLVMVVHVSGNFEDPNLT